MSTHERARAEYLARIHRAQDFIELNLGTPLTLESVAAVACFSPFHFHRVFSAVTGETLYQFILRIRLERAAGQLLRDPSKSVTAVALDCGFSSSATFARAFRAAYGMSASDWRSGGGDAAMNASTHRRKNCKTLGNDRKACATPAGYGQCVGETESTEDSEDPLARSALMMSLPAKQIVVESMDAFQVAYVRHIGPYAGNAELFGRLFGTLTTWAGPRGLLGQGTKMLIIYHDNPELTESDKLRISVCVSVPSGTKGEGEINVMEIPAGKYARARYEVGADEFAAAWQWLMADWLPSSGYQPDDRPCYELNLNDCREHPEHKFIVDLVLPVKPL